MLSLVLVQRAGDIGLYGHKAYRQPAPAACHAPIDHGDQAGHRSHAYGYWVRFTKPVPSALTTIAELITAFDHPTNIGVGLVHDVSYLLSEPSDLSSCVVHLLYNLSLGFWWQYGYA